MAGLNKIILIGNVGRDPEMRYTPDGTPVTSFSLAVNRRTGRRDSPEGVREETEWFDIVAWRRLAEICNQYVTKGKQIYVEGRLRSRTWEGQDGQKRFRLEVDASDVQLLGGGSSSASLPSDDFAATGGDISPDDLPF